MGAIKKHQPVKLIVGFIFQREENFKKAKLFLERKFGKIDFQSQILEFSYTDYYEKEIGKNLKRVFISFKKCILPQKLPEIKILTNSLEQKLAVAKLRTINIDPGYLEASKLVLATTKDYVHRIYLGKGIYAEITLFYQGKTFKPGNWTYPDYQTKEYIRIFNDVRLLYLTQVKNQSN